MNIITYNSYIYNPKLFKHCRNTEQLACFNFSVRSVYRATMHAGSLERSTRETLELLGAQPRATLTFWVLSKLPKILQFWGARDWDEKGIGARQGCGVSPQPLLVPNPRSFCLSPFLRSKAEERGTAISLSHGVIMQEENKLYFSVAWLLKMIIIFWLNPRGRF